MSRADVPKAYPLASEGPLERNTAYYHGDGIVLTDEDGRIVDGSPFRLDNDWRSRDV